MRSKKAPRFGPPERNTYKAIFFEQLTKAISTSDDKSLFPEIRLRQSQSEIIAGQFVLHYLTKHNMNHSVKSAIRESQRTIFQKKGPNWLNDQMQYSRTVHPFSKLIYDQLATFNVESDTFGIDTLLKNLPGHTESGPKLQLPDMYPDPTSEFRTSVSGLSDEQSSSLSENLEFCVHEAEMHLEDDYKCTVSLKKSGIRHSTLSNTSAHPVWREYFTFPCAENQPRLFHVCVKVGRRLRGEAVIDATPLTAGHVTDCWFDLTFEDETVGRIHVSIVHPGKPAQTEGPTTPFTVHIRSAFRCEPVPASVSMRVVGNKSFAKTQLSRSHRWDEAFTLSGVVGKDTLKIEIRTETASLGTLQLKVGEAYDGIVPLTSSRKVPPLLSLAIRYSEPIIPDGADLDDLLDLPEADIARLIGIKDLSYSARFANDFDIDEEEHFEEEEAVEPPPRITVKPSTPRPPAKPRADSDSSSEGLEPILPVSYTAPLSEIEEDEPTEILPPPPEEEEEEEEEDLPLVEEEDFFDGAISTSAPGPTTQIYEEEEADDEPPVPAPQKTASTSTVQEAPQDREVHTEPTHSAIEPTPITQLEAGNEPTFSEQNAEPQLQSPAESTNAQEEEEALQPLEEPTHPHTTGIPLHEELVPVEEEEDELLNFINESLSSGNLLSDLGDSASITMSGLQSEVLQSNVETAEFDIISNTSQLDSSAEQSPESVTGEDGFSQIETMTIGDSDFPDPRIHPELYPVEEEDIIEPLSSDGEKNSRETLSVETPSNEL